MKFQMRQTNSNTCNVHGAVIQVCQAPKGPVKKSHFGLDCREGFLWNVIGMLKVRAWVRLRDVGGRRLPFRRGFYAADFDGAKRTRAS